MYADQRSGAAGDRRYLVSPMKKLETSTMLSYKVFINTNEHDPLSSMSLSLRLPTGYEQVKTYFLNIHFVELLHYVTLHILIFPR